jgi:hypothetical protein
MPVPWNAGSYFKTGDEIIYNPNGKIYIANVKSIGQVPSIVPPYNNTYWNLYIPPGIITITSTTPNIVVGNTAGPATTLTFADPPTLLGINSTTTLDFTSAYGDTTFLSLGGPPSSPGRINFNAYQDLNIVSQTGNANFYCDQNFTCVASAGYLNFSCGANIGFTSNGQQVFNSNGQLIQFEGLIVNIIASYTQFNSVNFYIDDFYNQVNVNGIGSGYLADGSATYSYIPSAAASMPQQSVEIPPYIIPDFTLAAMGSADILDYTSFLTLDDTSIQRVKIFIAGNFYSSQPSIILYGKLYLVANAHIYDFIIQSSPANAYVPSRLSSTGLTSVSMVDYVDLNVGGIPFNVYTENAGNNKLVFTITLTAYNTFTAIPCNISNIRMAFNMEAVYLQQQY